jgi:hypothetical protein
LFPFNDGEAANQVGPIHWIDESPQNCSQVHTPQNYANVGRLIDEILLQLQIWNGTLVGEDCFPHVWHPNVFLMSLLLSVFTYIFCVKLKAMKRTPYFPSVIRNLFSDFAVFIAICTMTAIDNAAGVHTPKLHVNIHTSVPHFGVDFASDGDSCCVQKST